MANTNVSQHFISPRGGEAELEAFFCLFVLVWFFFRVVSQPESEVNVENVRIAQPESKSSLIGLNYCDLDD